MDLEITILGQGAINKRFRSGMLFIQEDHGHRKSKVQDLMLMMFTKKLESI